MEPCGNLYFLISSIRSTCPFPLFPLATSCDFFVCSSIRVRRSSLPAALSPAPRTQHPGQRHPPAAARDDETMTSNGNPSSPSSLRFAGRSGTSVVTYGCPDAVLFPSGCCYSMTVHYIVRKKFSRVNVCNQEGVIIFTISIVIVVKGRGVECV